MENYPIKYAVMPVTNYASGEDFVLGYIVTKVYLVSEYIRYTANGTKVSYDIVYPVKGLKSSQVMADLRKPEFDEVDICINAERNNDLFDNYDEAKKLCNEKNSVLFRNDIDNYTEKNNFIQDFELKVFEKTVSMPNPEDLKNNGMNR